MKTEQTREALLRDQEKRSPFYATFDYKFSHRRWWHFMLLLLLLNWQDFNALTRTTKVRAPKSLQNLVSWSMKNWKTLWKFLLQKSSRAYFINENFSTVGVFALGNMLDMAFKLNWNCPPALCQSNVIVTHLLNKLCSQLCCRTEEGGIKRSMRDWHTKEA